jgi:HEAT repeat protein
MKPFRKIAVVVIASGAVLGMSAVVFELNRGPKEAYYQGKSATGWLGELLQSNVKQGEALHAFREMGADAQPVLIDALGGRTASPASQWVHARLASLPYLGRLFSESADRQNLRSAAEIVVFNTDARTYPPELLRLLRTPNSEERTWMLGAVENQIGPDKPELAPILVSVLNDLDPVERKAALLSLAAVGRGASNTIPAGIQQ